MTLQTAFSAERALDQVLQGSSSGWTRHGGMLLVARQSNLQSVVSRFDQNLSALGQAPVKKVSMDFLKADLGYVCQICVHEMKLSIVGQPPSGLVTCRVSARPAAQTLALACALQTPPVAVSLRGGSLVFQRAP